MTFAFAFIKNLKNLKILPEIIFKELIAEFRKHHMTRKFVQKAANDSEKSFRKTGYVVLSVPTLEKIDQ